MRKCTQVEESGKLGRVIGYRKVMSMGKDARVPRGLTSPAVSRLEDPIKMSEDQKEWWNIDACVSEKRV